MKNEGGECGGVRVACQTPCTYHEYFTTDIQQLLSWTPRDKDKETEADRQAGREAERPRPPSDQHTWIPVSGFMSHP